MRSSNNPSSAIRKLEGSVVNFRVARNQDLAAFGPDLTSLVRSSLTCFQNLRWPTWRSLSHLAGRPSPIQLGRVLRCNGKTTGTVCPSYLLERTDRKDPREGTAHRYDGGDCKC
jgi:hypothetical protein